MEITLYVVGAILSFVGLFDLITRFREFWFGSIVLSLKTPEHVLKWQSIQIARACYFGAKKLHQLSKKIPDPDKRQKAITTTKELMAVRKHMYETIKKVGYSETVFRSSADQANQLYSEYIVAIKGESNGSL
ncbi:MAG: hypothetical protein RI601_04135 [Desulfurivibrionaceae bacterium]|nr:hypothetical protein [Desulfurivibrionaceae bacterium]